MAGAIFCIGIVGARAADLPITEITSTSVELFPAFTIHGFAGYLTGESREYVYEADGKKLSQLNWQIDNALIIGGGASFRPFDWLTLRAEGWTTLASSNAMDDYDWTKPGISDWSEWSHHPDTDLTTAYQIDVGAEARFVEADPVAISALVGYRFLTMKWEASNGNYIYSSDAGFRDQIGIFDGPVIDYEQSWHAPYLGLAVTYTEESFRLRGEFIGSPVVWADATDLHIKRDLLFKDSFDRTSMVAVSLSAEYDLPNQWTVFGKAEFQKYWNSKGDAILFDLVTEDFDKSEDSSGASHESFTLRFGLKKAF